MLPTEKQLSPGLTAPVRTWWRFMTIIYDALQVFRPFSQYPLLPGGSHWKPLQRCVHPHLVPVILPKCFCKLSEKETGGHKQMCIVRFFFFRQTTAKLHLDWFNAEKVQLFRIYVTPIKKKKENISSPFQNGCVSLTNSMFFCDKNTRQIKTAEKDLSSSSFQPPLRKDCFIWSGHLF